jgi:lactoylglutathione lyase
MTSATNRSERPDFRAPFPILYVADLGRSIHFYEQVLGFVPGYRWPTVGAPEFIVMRLGESAVGLCMREVAAELLGFPIVERGATQGELCVLVDDMDEACIYLREQGVHELVPPTLRPWNEYSAYFADPDGNPIQLYAQPENTA